MLFRSILRNINKDCNGKWDSIRKGNSGILRNNGRDNNDILHSNDMGNSGMLNINSMNDNNKGNGGRTYSIYKGNKDSLSMDSILERIFFLGINVRKGFGKFLLTCYRGMWLRITFFFIYFWDLAVL